MTHGLGGRHHQRGQQGDIHGRGGSDRRNRRSTQSRRALWRRRHYDAARERRRTIGRPLSHATAWAARLTAAKFAYSDRPVICTIGDGAFQMLGLNELITVKNYMKEWDNPQLIIMVLHNDDLTQVSWEMRTGDANPVWSTSHDVESIDYAGGPNCSVSPASESRATMMLAARGMLHSQTRASPSSTRTRARMCRHCPRTSPSNSPRTPLRHC